MIELDYNFTFESRAKLINLENIILGNVRRSMQTVVDALVGKIQSKFNDQRLAETVEGKVTGADVSVAVGRADSYEIIGTVYSTWPEMIWYEEGRAPGGKMPPKSKLVGWAVRKGITPDPAKVQLGFALAINAARLKKDKKKIPVDVLVDWMNKNGIVASEKFAFDSLAYAIGLKIVRTGIPGHFYFKRGLDETRPFITQSFEQVAQAAASA